MDLLWRICFSLLVLGAQATIIVTVFRMSPETFLKWKLMHVRGEEWFPPLNRFGEGMRRSPAESRTVVIVSVIAATLALDPLLALIWR